MHVQKQFVRNIGPPVAGIIGFGLMNVVAEKFMFRYVFGKPQILLLISLVGAFVIYAAACLTFLYFGLKLERNAAAPVSQ